MCAGAGASVGIRLSVKSSNRKGFSANGSFSSFLSFSQRFLPKFPCGSFRHFAPILNLRMNLLAALFPEAGDASGPNDSCGGIAEDELLSELTDNPGTTRGTKLSVLQIILFPFLVNRGSWPLTHS